MIGSVIEIAINFFLQISSKAEIGADVKVVIFFRKLLLMFLFSGLDKTQLP